eukprot:350895-Chlamydomonas_euryale.AAC.11
MQSPNAVCAKSASPNLLSCKHPVPCAPRAPEFNTASTSGRQHAPSSLTPLHPSTPLNRAHPSTPLTSLHPSTPLIPLQPPTSQLHLCWHQWPASPPP